MTQPHSSSSEVHPSVGHLVPFWLLATVFGTLLVLTGITVAAAQVELGNLNLYVAMAIAGLKATIVVLFFMHMFWDRGFNRLVFLGCLGFVMLFISFVLTDKNAYNHQIIPGQGKEMKDIHTPLGSPKT